MPDTASNRKQEEIFASDILSAGPGPVAVISYDDLSLHYCNRQFERTFNQGVTPMIEQPNSFSNLLDADLQIRLKTQLKLVYDNRQARNKYTIYSLPTADGKMRSYCLFASPIHELKAQEDTDYHIMLIPDLSKCQVPFISYDTRDLFLEQFADATFGTFEWIIPTDQTFWSEHIYDIYEIDKAGGPQPDLLMRYSHPDETQDVKQLMEETLRTNSTTNVKVKIATAKGTAKFVNLIMETVPDEEGQPFKLVGSIRDITEQCKIEEDLKRNVKDLNRSNKELEEFAYVASHDLQEPLRKISTFSDRLADKFKDKLEDEAKMYLDRIIASADSARVLIDNLLEFSRLSRSTQPFTEVNLDFVLREVKTELELVIEETGTTIKSDTLPAIEGVHSQLKQLFTNIIGNAIKFRKDGIPATINITVEQLDEAGTINAHLPLNSNPYYKIQVTDNGIGFEPEYAEKIFQIFQRLHAKSEYPGSGIGLAICKKITDNHKGSIYAENIPGTGARFTIILPAKQYKS